MELTIKIPDELKMQAEESNIDLSELIIALAKRELAKQLILKRLNSKEEQELTEWSVELGRKAKKGRFKKLLKEVSPKVREELLMSMSPEEKEEFK